MDFYRPFCKHIVLPLQAKWEGSSYLKHLRYLQESQYFPAEKVRTIQWKKIQALINHAYHHTPFYRKRFQQAGISPEDIHSWDDFTSIPILTKSEVQQHSTDMFADNTDKYISFLTSGSTGKPLKGYWNKDSSQFKRACGRRSELWAGCDLGDRIYCLYGNPEKKVTLRLRMRRVLLRRVSYLDTLQLTDESMYRFARLMLSKPPSLLWGHAHALYHFACFIEKSGLTGIQPKGMYSAGMVLHDWERKKVEDVFKCPLQDRYGSEEFGLIACECKKKEGLHINNDSHYVEFVNAAGEQAQPGSRGYIVVTDLTNHAMPFIRYNMEDIGIPARKPLCSCGRTQPLIDRIEGRVADFLVTPEGKMVSGISLTDHFGGSIPGIEQIQIIQDKSDHLLINLVKDGHFSEQSTQQIEKLVVEFFGEKMNYHCQFLEEIPKEPSGKFRFTICKLTDEHKKE